MLFLRCESIVSRAPNHRCTLTHLCLKDFFCSGMMEWGCLAHSLTRGVSPRDDACFLILPIGDGARSTSMNLFLWFAQRRDVKSGGDVIKS